MDEAEFDELHLKILSENLKKGLVPNEMQPPPPHTAEQQQQDNNFILEPARPKTTGTSQVL